MEPSGSGRRIWRVFVAYTTGLRAHPEPESYVDAVERAIAAAGHHAVGVGSTAAPDRPVSEIVADAVRDCDVYIGLFGMEDGPVISVPGQGDLSLAEFAFQIAGMAALPRLVFLLDAGAATGIPPSAQSDRERGNRLEAFRELVLTSGLVTRSFATPDELGELVTRSLEDLAGTQQRITSGLRQERNTRQTPFEPPFVVPAYFQDRTDEAEKLAIGIADPGVRLMTVVGRAGAGKSALVWRCLTDPPPGSLKIRAVVRINPDSARGITFRTVVADLVQLLPAPRRERPAGDPDRSPEQVMTDLLDEFPAGDRVVLVVDGLEALLDEKGQLADTALRSAVDTLVRGKGHALVVVATSRVKPAALPVGGVGAQRTLQLDHGLPPEYSARLLRELDPDSRLGLRDAPDDTIAQLHALTDGIPRALEAVAALLSTDRTLLVADVVRQFQELPPGQVAEALVGQAIDVLNRVERRVVEALAVFRSPVPPVAVEFLLQPFFVPGINATPILDSLARRQLVTSHDGRYTVQAADRVQILQRLPGEAPGDVSPAFTFGALRDRAVEYYLAVQPANREEERTRLIHDQPTNEDHFGRRILAGEIAALVDQLAREDDRPEAFAIHLDAPWGAGKSTLVRFIADELSRTGSRWIPVQVDAWRSSQLSPAWWALLSHLRTGVRASLGRTARMAFDLRWFAHEVSRLWRYALPLLAAVGVLLVFDIVNGKPSYLGSVGSVSAIVALFVTFATLGGKFLSLGSLQAARIHERVNQNPMDEVARQFRWIRGRVKQPVLIVLDDLDRCNGAFAVELLDAVQTLLRNRLDQRNPPPPLVVLAVGDHRWLEVAYEQGYSMFAQRVSEPGRPLGRLFLDKLFQLSVTLPKINAEQMGRYLSALLYGPHARPSVDPAVRWVGIDKDELIRDLQGEVRSVVHNAPEQVDEGLARVAGRAYELLDGPDFEGIVDYALKSRRADENRVLRERHLLERYADLLEPNPRAAKRFLMAYSVNYAARLSEGADFESQTLALWTVLSTRWPTLADWVLERLPDKSLDPEAADGHPSRLLLDPEVNRVIRSGKGGPLDRERVLRCCGYRPSDPAVAADAPA